MHPRLRLCAALLVASCADDERDVPDVARISFHDDVAPILNEHCAGCHTDGGLAPFVVDDYDTVVEWAEAIVASTHARTMPPFGADNSGSCNTFTDARWLADAELATLAQWLDEGTPAGTAPTDPLVPPVLPRLEGPGIAAFDTPDYVPLPETALDDHQCFRIDPGIDSERYIVAFEVVPGNATIVHHVLGFQVNPNVLDNDATMQALDDASPDRPGWDCEGAAGEDVIPLAVPVAWAPGAGAIEFPAGTGIPIGPDDVFVVQMHYNLTNGEGSDRTTVRIRYADTVAAAAVQSLADPFLESTLGPTPASLPAGAASTTWDWELGISQLADIAQGRDVEIWGFLPHMHQRGRKMHIRVARGGASECAAEIDRYDFAWQTAYFLEQPILATSDDRIQVTCDWDTRGDAAPVLPGFTTSAEMCTLGLYVVPR